jgi:hypothetical protein
MADPISDVFSTLRSMLQEHDVTWRGFLDTLKTTHGKLDGAQKKEFRARYLSYVEEELDARFEDWQRTCSLAQYIGRAHPLSVDLARHLEVQYDRDAFIKSYFTRCAQHFTHHPLDQFTVLSLNEIGARNALHLIKLFTTHRPAHLTSFAFSLERFMRVTPRTRHPEIFDALLSLPDPDALTTLTLKWNVALREESERNLHDALHTHLPRYTALTTFTLAEELETSSHITDLHEVIPHTVTHLSIHAEHVQDMTSWLATDLFARLDTLRLGCLNREVAKKIHADQLMLHLSHMNLAWDFREDPWRATRGHAPDPLKIHDLARAAHADEAIPQAQLQAETLSLGSEEPLTFEAFRTMLCTADGSPREFPFLKSLTLFDLDLDSLKLLLTRGAPCFPRLTSLSINFNVPAAPLDIAWHEAPIWQSVTYLRLIPRGPEPGHALDSFWALDSSRSIFPEVTEFELNCADLHTYTNAFPALIARFPKLRTLGSFSTGYSNETLTASLFELLREHDLFETLYALNFYLYERIGLYTSTPRIAYWVSLVLDEEIPVHLRRYIFHQLVAYPTKDDLLNHIAPAMGVKLPKSASKNALITRLATTLPKAVQSYNTYPEFAQRPPAAIPLHTP